MLEKGQNAVTGASARSPERLGRYELIARIADGGMAEVYLARQLGPMNFQKVVVVKKIHPNLARQKEFIGMLLDEARISALIKHPRVVDIYDLGVSRGTYFIAMEYLSGQPLTHVITRGRSRVPLDVYSAARIIADAAEGLHAAHNLKTLSGRSLELVHRDVSPSNIIVLYDGNVKLVDFGVAKARGRITETGSNQIKGKVGYVSPEQIMENPADRRSDVFSLGVVMWESLALRRLFDAESEAGKLKQILDGVPLPPSAHRPEVPYELDRICLRALAVAPADRFQSAGDVKEAIENFLRDANFRREAGAIHRFMTETFAAERAQQEGLLRRLAEADRSAAGLAGSRAKPVIQDDPDIDTGVQTFVRAPGDVSSINIGKSRASRPAGPTAETTVVDGERAETDSQAGQEQTAPTRAMAGGTPPARPVRPVLPTPNEPSAPWSAAATDPRDDPESIITSVPRPRGKRGTGTGRVVMPASETPSGALRSSSRHLPLPAPRPVSAEGPVEIEADDPDDYRDVTEVDSSVGPPLDLGPGLAIPVQTQVTQSSAPTVIEGRRRVAAPPPAPPARSPVRSSSAKSVTRPPLPMAGARSASAAPAAPPAARTPPAAKTGDPVEPTIIRELPEPAPIELPDTEDFAFLRAGRKRKLWIAIGGVGAATALLVAAVVWASGQPAGGTRAVAEAPMGDQAAADQAAADQAAADKAMAERSEAAALAEKAAAEATALAAAEKARADRAEAEKAARERAARKAAANRDKGRARPAVKRPPPRTAAGRAGNPADLYREGARLYLAGNIAAARGKFQAALSASPRFAPAHRGLGLVYERSGQKVKAVRSLQTYLRLAPSAPDAASIRTRIDRLR